MYTYILDLYTYHSKRLVFSGFLTLGFNVGLGGLLFGGLLRVVGN